MTSETHGTIDRLPAERGGWHALGLGAKGAIVFVGTSLIAFMLLVMLGSCEARSQKQHTPQPSTVHVYNAAK